MKEEMGIWRRNRNRTCKWKARKWESKGKIKVTRLKNGKTKRGTRTANYGPGVVKGMADVPRWFVESNQWGKWWNISFSPTGCWLHIIKIPIFTIFVHQCPNKEWARPLDCCRAEVCASLATKSTAVQLQYTSKLTVANSPTQGCTIRRFCWDDQHDQIHVYKAVEVWFHSRLCCPTDTKQNQLHATCLLFT